MMTYQDREDAALDALIFLALRGEPGDDERVLAMLDDDDIDIDSLPELSEEDRVAMEKVDIEAIIAVAKE